MDDEPDQRHSGRASRRALKTRQKLLDAALFIFNSHGVDACAIEDITESADVGKGTFYRHFMDKLDILKTLLDEAVADLVLRMPPPEAMPLSIEDRLTQIMTAHVSFISERHDLFLLLLQGQNMIATRPASLPGLQPSIQRYLSEVEQRLHRALPPSSSSSEARHLAMALAAAVLGTATIALGAGTGKHELMANLDRARLAVLSGVSRGMRVAI